MTCHYGTSLHVSRSPDPRDCDKTNEGESVRRTRAFHRGTQINTRWFVCLISFRFVSFPVIFVFIFIFPLPYTIYDSTFMPQSSNKRFVRKICLLWRKLSLKRFACVL